MSGFHHEGLREHRCRWRKAWKILNAPIPGLPETAEITKHLVEILPAIAKLLAV